MPAATFIRRLGKLEQTASRNAASAWGELLALMTDDELEEVLAILTRNNVQDACDLPPQEAERYVEIVTRLHGRLTPTS